METQQASQRLTPTNVAVVGNELAIAWNDGAESYFPLEFLRKACPCAVCQGEADVLGQVERPTVTLSEKSFQLQDYAWVGGYAFQPRWSDGHGTGLYTFQYLRKLREGGTP
jgi:DUF971 family protein